MAKSILVVDDEHEICASMRDILMQRGCHVDVAESGENAVELVSQNTYDIIFLDIKLGGISGFKTAQEIKRLRPLITIILMTAYYKEEVIRGLSIEGVHSIVSKPFEIDRLYELIEAL